MGRGINKIWCYTLPSLGLGQTPQHSYDIYQIWSSHREAKDGTVHQTLLLPLPKVQTPECLLLTPSSGLLLEFPLHWRVAVTQCLISWGKLVVTLCSRWHMGLSKNLVVSYSCCRSAQACRQCSYQALPLLSLLPAGRGWSIARGDCSTGRQCLIFLPIPPNRAAEFLLKWHPALVF